MARVIGFPVHRAQNDRIWRAFLGFSSMSVAGKFEYQAIRSSSSMRLFVFEGVVGGAYCLV